MLNGSRFRDFFVWRRKWFRGAAGLFRRGVAGRHKPRLQADLPPRCAAAADSVMHGRPRRRIGSQKKIRARASCASRTNSHNDCYWLRPFSA